MAPSLAGKGSSTDTLFVFAREMSGPPMPVAIVRATKKDLPFTFQLDDSTSPMPSRKLSSAGPVVIVARLSKSGQAMPQSGDLEGTSQPVNLGWRGSQSSSIVKDPSAGTPTFLSPPFITALR